MDIRLDGLFLGGVSVVGRLTRGLPVVDADFDHLAAVTGQATEWIVPRGTVG